MLIWGWGLVDNLKFKGSIAFEDIFSPFQVTQVIYISTCFWATHLVLKKYYPAKKYGKLVLGFLGLLTGFIAFRYLLEEVLLPFFFNGMRNYAEHTHPGYYVLDNIYYALVYILFGTLVFLLDYQLRSQKNEAILKQERMNAELAFLRSQISPHFLFNSLNNIYALSCHQPDRAPNAILTLSDLVRYMLYEKQEKVSLQKEWQYIQSLIDLQQLRYEKPLQLHMNAQGNMEQMIEPYLLIPFVENVFKHGVVEDAQEPVNITLNSTVNFLEFSIENKTADRQKDKDGGIGLENTKRRLELLYPAKHSLHIDAGQNRFSAVLKINYSK